MLVLSRQLGESIVIGAGPQAVTVSIERIGKHKVRLGVQAPREVPVWRSELARQTLLEEEPNGEQKNAGQDRPL